MEKGRAGAVLVTCRPWQAALSARPCLGHRASPRPTWRKACAESRAYARGGKCKPPLAGGMQRWRFPAWLREHHTGSKSCTCLAPWELLPFILEAGPWGGSSAGIHALLQTNSVDCQVIYTTASASSPLQGLCCASAR